jgi:hypothetical protein
MATMERSGSRMDPGMQTGGMQAAKGIQNPALAAQGAQGSHAQDPQQQTEGWLARTIEDQTAKLPSDIFLWAAGGAMCGSLALQAMGRQHDALFVGQWVPTLLILGLYNKLVKVAGHDRMHG